MIPTSSNSITDRRVDSLLQKHQFFDFTIYYSPITSLAIVWGLLLLMAIPLLMNILPKIPYWYVWVPGWGIFAYLLASYLNNSFAINGSKLIVVNPNFPFKRVQAYNLTEIKSIKIASAKYVYLAGLWGVFGGNYVEIETESGKRRFHCSELAVDAYDENWTKLTIDDLQEDLKQKGLKLEFKL